MWSEPATRAPFRGCDGPYSARTAMRPGISVSAIAISLRPQPARAMSAMAESARWASWVMGRGLSVAVDRLSLAPERP